MRTVSTFFQEQMERMGVSDNKYLSWVYGVDRKICHEGKPRDAEQ